MSERSSHLADTPLIKHPPTNSQDSKVAVPCMHHVENKNHSIIAMKHSIIAMKQSSLGQMGPIDFFECGAPALLQRKEIDRAVDGPPGIFPIYKSLSAKDAIFISEYQFRLLLQKILTRMALAHNRAVGVILEGRVIIAN